MGRYAAAAVAVILAACAVTGINHGKSTNAPSLAPSTSVTSTRVPVESDEDWNCHEVTEHSNGVCGSDLPEGFSVQDIAECTTPALYSGCAAAVRARISD